MKDKGPDGGERAAGDSPWSPGLRGLVSAVRRFICWRWGSGCRG